MRVVRAVGWTVAAGAALVLIVGGGAYGWASRHAAIAPVDRPDPDSFDPALVEHGRELAAIANCGVCHTTSGNAPYSGGYELDTPFGTIYSTNITPDPEHGIGAWSEEAFIRAMHQGIDREGRHLYPAFPYDRFSKVDEEDIRAIYAYIMADVQPSDHVPPPHTLPFPYNIRQALEGWKFLYLDDARWEPDPDRDEEWNLGAYLVEGLAHCGTCHSPRDAFGGEMTGENAYGGGFSGEWHAPALNRNNPAPVPWSTFSMVDYLLDGWHEHHGIAAGPMQPVVNNLHALNEDYAFAIAAYVMDLMGGELSREEHDAISEEVIARAEALEWGHPDAPPVPQDPVLQRGAEVFEAQCVRCHEASRATVPLAQSTAVHMPTPANVLLVTIQGIRPPLGALGKDMESRDLQIPDDGDMAALIAFVRDRFSDKPQWEDIDEVVHRIRREN